MPSGCTVALVTGLRWSTRSLTDGGVSDYLGEYQRRDIFNYIEMLYNLVRRHGNNAGLTPVDFEKQYFTQLSGTQNIGGLPVVFGRF